jgi:hypothetical protein
MPSSWGDSITLRSFAPLPWRTWKTPRGTVDVFDPQSRDLGSPEPGGIGGGERGAALQALRQEALYATSPLAPR